MVKINVKRDETGEIPNGQLVFYERQTNERIVIFLPTLNSDGVLIHHEDGKIEIGNLPSIDYYTNNPPKTDEITIFIDGWFHIHYELVIDVREELTYIAVLSNRLHDESE